MLTKSTPSVAKTNSFLSSTPKLVYLDQSFLSDMCFREESVSSKPILKRLFLKLQSLQTIDKIVLVVSDVHCQETSAFPEQYAGRMKELWQFQNKLVSGRIAGNWRDVFVAQHRRFLRGEDVDSYPVSDIKYRDPPLPHLGVRIVMTNSWRLRVHRPTPTQLLENDKRYREVIDRQAKNIPSCHAVEDCLAYVSELWRTDFRTGIMAWKQRKELTQSFDQLGNSPGLEGLAFLNLPHITNSSLLPVIKEVLSGMDTEVTLRRWSELLDKDSIGPCPSIRIRAAFEAELLWTYYQGKRNNPKEFRENFGWSRQNDIAHVSAFIPYVNALTTDKDMHNLCLRRTTSAEIKRFSCRIFSSKNYQEFEDWLDAL